MTVGKAIAVSTHPVPRLRDTTGGTRAPMIEPKPKDPDDGPTATDPPPGPADHGRDGGMATREVAPDVITPTEEPPD